MKQHLAALALCATVAMQAAAQQQDFSTVEIKSQPLAGSVHMLTGAGGNLALSIGDDAAFLVDDQFAPLSARIKAAIASISKKPVKFVLNTHWHGDHTGGNENFGRAGSVIVAHENVRRRMSAEQFSSFASAPIPASPRAALPVVTFASDVTFHLNGDEIHAFHVPRAHTDGDTIVHFRRANVIHLGDVFFNRMYPFIDAASGGSWSGTIAAVDKVLAIAAEDTKLVPGHGPLATRADLLAYRQMLLTVGERLQALAREGRSLQDAIAARPTAEFDAAWGEGFFKPDQFVGLLWRELGRPAAVAPAASR
jgi:glyoxylase-like metal-dependent hydrolase (beta-lactamase superfamily II)